MAWRPLSKRDQPDARLDEPTEGLPGYLWGPVSEWAAEAMYDRVITGNVRVESLKALQLRFKLEPPLDFRHSSGARQDLLGRMGTDEDFGLDVLDYMLYHLRDFTPPRTEPVLNAAKLQGILNLGGSVWEVAVLDRGEARFALSRRAVGPTREVIAATSPNTRAHAHLVTAWNRLSGRNPDPSSAYREAIRAIEAVAKPVVLPNNDRATLGTMIAALRDKPEKWQTTVGAVDDVRTMLELVWKGQHDRHGTDEEAAPLSVSQDEADVAVHIAVSVVRLFAGGHIRAVE